MYIGLGFRNDANAIVMINSFMVGTINNAFSSPSSDRRKHPYVIATERDRRMKGFQKLEWEKVFYWGLGNDFPCSREATSIVVGPAGLEPATLGLEI